MAEDIRISELSNVSSLGNNDLIEVSQVNAQSETGYDSKKATLINVGDRVCNGIEYANALYTSNKKIIGAINELTTYIPVWNNTASGAIATFDTSLALPLQDCTIEINAVQESGTPTPSSPKLISGFTGANIKVAGSNLTDEQWELGTIDNATGENVSGSSSLRTTNYIPVKPNTTYYFYIGGTGTGSTNPYLYDQNKQYIGRLGSYLRNQTFTTPSNAYYIRLGLQTGYGTTYNNDISINYPATDTAYHAYNPNSKIIPITWQSEAGTVYGGSLDVTSGVLTVTHKFITFDFTSTADIGEGYRRKSYNLGADKAVYPPSVDKPQTCNVAPYLASYADKSTHFYVGTDTCNVILPSNTPTSTTIEVVYELVTPTTYQLTPTQINAIVGTNNVFTDTNGDTSVVYACSLKDYIDGQ